MKLNVGVSERVCLLDSTPDREQRDRVGTGLAVGFVIGTTTVIGAMLRSLEGRARRSVCSCRTSMVVSGPRRSPTS